MKREFFNSGLIQFLGGFLIRFLLLSFAVLVVYIVQGGRLNIVFHAAPIPFFLCLVGLGILIRSERFPSDPNLNIHVKDFRKLSWQLLWSFNLLVLLANFLILTMKSGKTWDVMVLSLANGIVGASVCTIFFLSLIITPIPVTKEQAAASSSRPEKAKLLFSKSIYGLGYLTFGLIGLFGLLLIVKAFEPARSAIEVEASSRAYERISKYQEEYIAKNCRELPWEDRNAKFKEFEDEELELLRKSPATKN